VRDRDLEEYDLDRDRYLRLPVLVAGGGERDRDREAERGRYVSERGPNRVEPEGIGDRRGRSLGPGPPNAPPLGPPGLGPAGGPAPLRATGGAGEILRRGRTIETLITVPSSWASCMWAMAFSASASVVNKM